MLNRKQLDAVLFSGICAIMLFGCSSTRQFTGRPEGEAETPTSATGAEKEAKPELATGEVAVIQTRFGDIVFGFYEKDALQHTANFKKLGREGFYDGCTFHRVIPNFVIQGGSTGSKDEERSNDGSGGPGYTIPAEIGVKHTRGAVAAARMGDDVNPEKSSNGSQFYICLRDIPHLDAGGYSVFGQVIEGMDVVDKIVGVETDDHDNPLERIEMKVTIETR